ncbi:oocyte zinc finger protein XlCOF6.1 isoform X3 [Pieris rapae]|uniref:oocyte zinc finger protein XlCOF6.1 isoform X3 n=1 Tax=Pieris rapae TaxID=64459 RepID=UPI001E27AD6F|nr:oocyte zinc finger protein XlCOF6.1 isoform X3 [Pieris rapae]
MAEVITVKVEPDYYGENAEELKSDQHDYQNVCSEEIKIEEDVINTPQMNIDFVDVKSEVDTSIVKDEPQENDFILPDLDARDGPPLLGCGVTEDDLNRNAVKEARNICDFCQRAFLKKSHLRMHKILHSHERLECHVCYLRFEKVEDYNDHLLSHDRNYSCFICGKRFKSLSNLQNHKKLHTDIPFFKCDHCSKEFTHQANLSRHQKLGICKNKHDLTCPVCNKVFEKAFFLKSHLKKHTTEKPFQCDLCSMFFKHKSTLARHIQLHSGVRPYSCTYCNKTFSHRGLLEPHLRKHTGEKPFPCPRCSKKFSHKHNMLRHLERHAKEKNLKCQLCFKVFPRESRLIYHMRSHTNSKPFKCDVCSKKFTHKSNVLRHYSRKHPNEKYEPKFTDATVAKQVWEKLMQKLSKEEVL